MEEIKFLKEAILIKDKIIEDIETIENSGLDKPLSCEKELLLQKLYAARDSWQSFIRNESNKEAKKKNLKTEEIKILKKCRKIKKRRH